MRRTLRTGCGLVAVLAAAALVATGCTSGSSGSGGDTTPSSSPTASTPGPTASSTPGRTDLPDFPDASRQPDLPAVAGVRDIRRFLAAVFSDTQREWQQDFATAGRTYTPARLTIFDSTVRTGCGTQSSRVGPFYCPADLGVYLDVSFFAQMEQRYGVTGDFSVAFVVAHELGHHIQFLTGTTAAVTRAGEADPSLVNGLSVRAELQADCYAGVWAHSTYERGLLEQGDLAEALRAAAVVGDDFLQRSATGTIQPETWTHGSSAQRQRWLQIGYRTGAPAQCDTFAAA